ncbi:MAG: hypothetical protein JWR84_2153 [Caulobacter sp.]|nr:hypothetical protein [Caulobacter sp.]
MRLLSLALVGFSALALSACDELAPDRHGREQAKADCCCKDSCPTRAPGKVDAKTTEAVEVATTEETVRTGGHGRKAVRHARGGGARHEYSYRSGTEGVGYLDEESGYRGGGGGYRRVGTSVSVDERETYSESARYSESESGYSYSSGGGVIAYGEGGRGGYGGQHGRRGGGGYAGVDRDGYLTWPGKTE